MDWIKVKTVHILDEYTDLSDAEFRAWIKIMALTARLEHEPTQGQIIEKRIHPRTLSSLEEKLKTHRTSVELILNKVREDVEKVLKDREYSKNKKQEYRSHKPVVQTSVHIPVHMDVQQQIREDKTRVDNISKKKPADAPFVLPSKEEIQESSDPKIEEYIRQVCARLYEEKIFPEVHAFKNKMIKGKKNGRGVLHVLTRCYMAKPEDPWGYCQKIISVEDGNYNERDYRKTAQ
jgi:hypothetical protein